MSERSIPSPEMKPLTKPLSKTPNRVPRAGGGGPAAMGGLNFQAAATAIALVACATGRSLDWWGAQSTIPIDVWSETGGAGDDIRLVLTDGRKAEVQAKRRLRVGTDMWEAIMKLARGVHHGDITLGLLAVSPGTGQTIADDLAEDILRIAAGRTDDLTDTGQAFLQRLSEADLPSTKVCQGLAIQTLAALPSNAADIRAAVNRLERLMTNPADASRAWSVLLADASLLIERRSARDALSIGRLLSEQGLGITLGDMRMPTVAAAALSAWTMENNSKFRIIGVGHALSLADAWIPVSCRVKLPETETETAGLQEAMRRYHGWNDRNVRGAKFIDPLTLGRFYRKAVVVAGPGMGKSTVLKRLAATYAFDNVPVARASLKSVATRMRDRGETFAEAFFQIALGDSPVPNAERLLPGPWVLLCDGLDECGSMQSSVTEGLLAYATAHPGARLVVVTRPVGYQPAALVEWRHYELTPFDDTSVTPNLASLLDEILRPSSRSLADSYGFVAEKIKGSKAGKLAARSPMLLSLSASLLARKATLTGRLGDLYRQIVDLIESEPSPREISSIAPGIRAWVLDFLGYQLTLHPLTTAQAVEDACASALSVDLSVPPLSGREKVDEAIAHWEALGVIERLHHDGEQAFTFVHKTIGEYVAARYVLRLKELARRTAFADMARIPEWSEVLGFAATLGGATEVCQALLEAVEGDASYQGVLQALPIAIEPLRSVPVKLRQSLISKTVELIQSPSREVGTAAAVALSAVTTEASDEIAVAVRPLLYDARDWVRLGAWATIVQTGGTQYEYDEMKAVFAEIPKLAAEMTKLSFGRGLRLFGYSNTQTIEPFALTAARRILETECASDAESLIKAALDHEHLGSVGFLRALMELLREFDCTLHLAAYKPLNWNFDHKAYTEAAKVAYVQVFKPLAVPAPELPAEIVTFPCLPVELSALWSLCEFDNRLASDVWHWTKGGQAESLAEAGRAVCLIADLPLERIRFQARIFLRRLADSKKGASHVFDLPDIDHPPVDWSRAAAFDVDPLKLEPLLFHESEHAALLAARLIDGCAEPATKLSIGKRALDGGRYLTPALGAALARNADAATGLALVYTRLQRSDEIGLRSLYDMIRRDIPAFDERTTSAIARGLKASDYVAVEAAELALAYANLGYTELIQTLEAGYEHWVTAERPLQENNVVPPTPRHILLKAIFALKPPHLDRLIALSGDRRSEVSTLARERLDERLEADPRAAGRIFEAIVDGRLGLTALDLLLNRPKLVTPDRVARLLTWYDSPVAGRRERVISLLKEPFMGRNDIITWAYRLREDEDFHIREAGHRLLREHRVS